MKFRSFFICLLISALLVPSVAMAQKDKSSWVPNPNPSKYFLGPTAIPMEKKTAYYQNSYVLFNEFYYGFTNWFSMGVGFEFISTFVTMANPPFRPIVLANPKVAFKVADKFYVGVSGLYFNVTALSKDHNGSFGLAIGQFTYGTTENNLTAGVAYGYSWDGMADRPVFTLGGSWRAGKRIALITEDYIVPTSGNEYYPVFMYGMRFIGDKMCFDLAFINTTDVMKADIIGIPYIGLTVNF
ncbi:MAG TPA: hypothetical protein PLP69_05925 [Bacteroidales bacterium]|nr:hypothetical protein [Bacteroidales bacterium]